MIQWTKTMEKDYLSSLKEEFNREIAENEVDLSCLKKYKLKSFVLQSEVGLRKIFGDEIVVHENHGDEIEGEKNIVKLSEEDISFDSEVKELCENLVDYNFNSEVNVLLNKFNDEEE